jgi:gamma-glutamyltranspeptidase/glutathione hydrolase
VLALIYKSQEPDASRIRPARRGQLATRAAGGGRLRRCLGLLLAESPMLRRRPRRRLGGMVVTAHHLATEVGVEICATVAKRSDAAVAVGYALAVVYPQAGNHRRRRFHDAAPADGRVTFLDFREKAPAAATETMFQDARGEVSRASRRTAGKPSAFPDGPRPRNRPHALRHHVARGAHGAGIRLARDGFVLGQGTP